MFKKCLLLAFSFPTLTSFAGTTLVIKWDLNPQVLLITSYQNAHQQPSQDQIVFKKLSTVYGADLITAAFSPEDANMHAEMLINLINKFNLKKVFVLNNNFNDYLLAESTNQYSNLVRVLHQFTNVDFYFFNSFLNENIKLTNNIYEIRFDQPNKKNPEPTNYGSLVAAYLYQQLINEQGNIDTNKYNFDTDAASGNKYIVKIAIFSDKNVDTQKRAKDFEKELQKRGILNAEYSICPVALEFSNANLVSALARGLYQKDRANIIVNFISGLNNNAIAHAASTVAANPQYTKTIKFISFNIENQNDYGSTLLFSANSNYNILEGTPENNIPKENEILGADSESFHTYGVNDDLTFINGL